MALTDEYLEKVESMSPASAGFSFEGGKAVVPYIVPGNRGLRTYIIDLLGDVSTYSDGRLQRTLPRSHPRFPFLYAERITSIQGLGKPTFEPAVTKGKESPSLPYYADYPFYILTVEFTPRPYAVLPDSAITVVEQGWIREDGSGPGPTSRFTTEYERFVDIEIIPGVDYITAQYGQSVFRSSSGPDEGPNGVAFTGNVRMLVNKAVVKVKWFQVPYKYVIYPDSYIMNYLGRINQTEFLGFPEGSLLYVGVGVRRYTPYFPSADSTATTKTFVAEKICDIEFIFEYTKRTAASLPTPEPENKNWLVAGHNLHPWYATRGFYYTTVNVSDPSKQVPTYTSFPMQLLFTRPDIA